MIDKPKKVAPPEAVTTPIPDQPPKNEKQRGSGFTTFVAALALFVAVLGVGVGYKHWQRLYDKVKLNRSNIAVLQEQQTEESPELKDQMQSALQQQQTQFDKVQQLHQETKQFAQSVDAQISQVTTLQAQLQQANTPDHGKTWKLAEIQFLLELANQQAHLSHNKPAALAALKQADKRLAQLGAVNLIPVRQQLTRDIAHLENFYPPNLAELSQVISALILRLVPYQVPKEEKSEVENTASGNESESMWGNIKGTLNDAIVVRQHNPALQTALDSASRYKVYQLLQLQLESLRLALFQQHTENFQTQLLLVRNTLTDYYPEDIAHAYLEDLQPLEGLDLQAKWPDISASLQQLQSAQQTMQSLEEQP